MTVNIQDALKLIQLCDYGILSTNSLEMEGFPFGSITPYCLDENNNPIIYISTIAQHTKNVIADSKVCLTVLEEAKGDDKQAKGRVSVLADALKIDKDSEEFKTVSEKYFKSFPKAVEYASFHDFFFFRLDVKRIRYIAGFGKIVWIEKDKWKEVES